VFLERGAVLARGVLLMGDHLFVDRVSFVMREPKRGEITVFVTDGIVAADGKSLGGRYYIKRLMGMPGDTLKISDGKLYVKAAGSSEFVLLDNAAVPAMARVYDSDSGYHGYSHHPGSTFLKSDNAVFKVPPGQYFMLGDNSRNSRDSRFWGTVPRANLIGPASLVWWPFSERWGTVDRAAPG
jgi:signal peptidase I